ncbi:MAG: hypothetical protein HQL52_05905 [Magnetococcales bacterium]|nr:hypothetical protein [Magnetococcales bacterium]
MEAVIGHQKVEGRLNRNFPQGVFGDKANTLLAGIGYNLRAVLRKLRLLFAWILALAKQTSARLSFQLPLFAA